MAQPDAVVNVKVDTQGVEQLKDIVENLPTVVKESKAGYKTTEFWVAIIVALLTVLEGVPLPPNFEGPVLAVIGVAYVLSRGIAKSGVPSVEAPST